MGSSITTLYLEAHRVNYNLLNCITVRLASMYIKCKTRTSVNQILYKNYVLSYIKSKIKRVCELTSFPVVICNQICNTLQTVNWFTASNFATKTMKIISDDDNLNRRLNLFPLYLWVETYGIGNLSCVCIEQYLFYM